MTYLAAIDVGSLTVRLALAEAEGPGRFRVAAHFREVTRLGEGVAARKALAPEAISRTLAALGRFGREIKARGVVRARGVATQAVRQAANGPEFLRQAAAALGVPVSLISPEEEARLTLAGVLSVLDPAMQGRGPLVVFDVGGGSSEFVLLEPGREPFFAGLPLGVLSVPAAQGLADPPRPEQLARLEEEVARWLEILYKKYFINRLPAPPTLVGTAGAVTTLAAMAQEMTAYAPARVNNYRLTRARLEELAQSLVRLPEAQRAQLPGLEPAKAGVMVAGVILVQKILETFRQDFLITIDAGLLEGLLTEISRG